MKRLLVLCFILLWWVVVPLSNNVAHAQRGMGDTEGVVRSQAVTKQVTGSAVIEEVVVEECKHTTGRYPIGVHLLVKDTDDQSLNLHLGPEPVLTDITTRLQKGMEISFEAFQTEKLPKNFYIVEVLSFGGKDYVLRDESLRPRWAGQKGRVRWLR